MKDNSGYSRAEQTAYTCDDKVMVSTNAWYLQPCHLQARRKEDALAGTDWALGKSNTSSEGAEHAALHPSPMVTEGSCDVPPQLSEQLPQGTSKNKERKEPSWVCFFVAAGYG